MGDVTNKLCWRLAQAIAWVLDPAEREAVLGDVAESDHACWRDLAGIAGLVVRRHFELWKTAQPWLGIGGLVVPILELYFGRLLASPSVQLGVLLSQGVLPERAMTRAEDLGALVCGVLLVFAWSASAGLALGAAFRRSAWIYAILSGYWLGMRGFPFWLMPDGLMIIVPFLIGVYLGSREAPLSISRTAKFAAATALLTILMQVEQSREAGAMLAWRSGVDWHGEFTFTLHLIPLLAIVWQFGLLTAARIGIQRSGITRRHV